MPASLGIMAEALFAKACPAQGVVAFLHFAMYTGLTKFYLVSWKDIANTSHRRCMKKIPDGWEDENRWDMSSRTNDNIEIIETTYAENFAALDGEKTSYYAPYGKAGWLSPEGEFWGCNYEGHWALASFVLHTTCQKLEEAGYIHVDCEGKKGLYTWRKVDSDPTPAQDAWLERNGHDIDPGGSRARKNAEKIRLGKYTIDAAADRAAFERMMAKAPKRN